MPTNTYVALNKVTVGTATNTITFNSIGGTYADLVIVISAAGSAGADIRMQFNSDTGTNYSRTYLSGDGVAAASGRATSTNSCGVTAFGTLTTTLGGTNSIIQIMNYSNSTTYKTVLMRSNDASSAGLDAIVSTWRNTAAITSITLSTSTGNFSTGSTFSLYGIAVENTSAAKATGGTIYADSTYWYHVFGASGTFTPSQTITCDTLVVGAGGGGGWNNGGGGGGGEVVINTGSSYTSGSAKTVTIGAGGVSGTSTSSYGTNGGNSSVSTITTALGGGAGGHGDAVNTALRAGQTGGSGGGGCLGYNGGSPSGSNTFAGGNSLGATDNYQAGGGGGATAAGTAGISAAAGNGGQGYAIANIFSGLALSGITHVGSGGGGGGSLLNTATPMRRGLGGTGAGDGAMQNSTSGNFNPGNGVANAGGGGGGGAYTGVNSRLGGTGGSGLVIIRYLK